MPTVHAESTEDKQHARGQGKANGTNGDASGGSENATAHHTRTIATGMCLRISHKT